MATHPHLNLWKEISDGTRFFLIAGPCVIENEALCLEISGYLAKVCGDLDIRYIFKASFDKANRSSARSFRGPGLEAGLAILEKVKEKHGLPLLTDIHQVEEAQQVESLIDVIQIPANLSSPQISPAPKA